MQPLVKSGCQPRSPCSFKFTVKCICVSCCFVGSVVFYLEIRVFIKKRVSYGL
jgi:hypothetical protein